MGTEREVSVWQRIVVRLQHRGLDDDRHAAPFHKRGVKQQTPQTVGIVGSEMRRQQAVPGVSPWHGYASIASESRLPKPSPLGARQKRECCQMPRSAQLGMSVHAGAPTAGSSEREEQAV